MHKVFVRTGDSEGRWGPASHAVFEVSAAKAVTGAERFIGTPPTPGRGVPITATPRPGKHEGEVSFSAQARRQAAYM
jgi:hypothetical protein